MINRDWYQHFGSVAATTVVVFVAAFLTGCAAPQTQLDAISTHSAKTIAILPVNAPQHVGVHNMGAGMAFGIIGAAIQGNYDQNHTKAYVAALNQLNDKLGTETTGLLADNLARRGLQVSVLTGQRAKLTADGKDDFSGIKTDADILLVAWFGYTGWWSGTISPDYHPWVELTTELIDPRTLRVLYRQSYTAFNEPHTVGLKFIDVSETAKYANFDELMAHVPESVEALRVGERAIIAQLILDLQLGSSNLEAKAAASTGSVKIQSQLSETVPAPVASAPSSTIALASASAPSRPSTEVQPESIRFQTPTQEFGDGRVQTGSLPVSTSTPHAAPVQVSASTLNTQTAAPAPIPSSRQSSISASLAKNESTQIGTYQELADTYARQSACQSRARSVLKMSNQGTEIYSALCASGDHALVSCAADQCHEMK